MISRADLANERPTDSRARILCAARTLLAAAGLGGASLREIIREAGVNPAAVHYHFGSREALVAEVIATASRTLADARRKGLAREPAGNSPKEKLRTTLRAFAEPILRAAALEEDDPFKQHLRVLAHARLDPSTIVQRSLADHEIELRAEFDHRFEQALPHLSSVDREWRIRFANAACWDMLSQPAMLARLPGRKGTKKVARALIEEFLEFAIAGMLRSESRTGRKPKTAARR